MKHKAKGELGIKPVVDVQKYWKGNNKVIYV